MADDDSGLEWENARLRVRIRALGDALRAIADLGPPAGQGSASLDAPAYRRSQAIADMALVDVDPERLDDAIYDLIEDHPGVFRPTDIITLFTPLDSTQVCSVVSEGWTSGRLLADDERRLSINPERPRETA